MKRDVRVDHFSIQHIGPFERRAFAQQDISSVDVGVVIHLQAELLTILNGLFSGREAQKTRDVLNRDDFPLLRRGRSGQ
jgi:hypothetical protein